MNTQLKFASAVIMAFSFSTAAFAADPSAPAASAPAKTASSTPAKAPPSAQVKADASAVNTACAAEAKTAGCSGEVVGKGLVKCLDAYKKANKSFKLSDGCQASLKQLHSDKKAGK